MIVEVEITPEMKAEILRNAPVGTLNSSTLVKGGIGNKAGLAGEMIVAKYLPRFIKATKAQNMSGYDFIGPDGQTYDVKTTGNNKFFPKPDFACKVDIKPRLKCDNYIFTRVNPELTKGWIKGYISRARMVQEATIRYAGEAYNDAGVKTIGNHMVVLAHQLDSIENLKG